MQIFAQRTRPFSKTFVLPFFQDSVDAELIQKISGIRQTLDFQGKRKEVLPLYHPEEGTKIFLLGLGKEKDQAKAADAFRSLAYRHHASWSDEVSIELSHLPLEMVFEAGSGTRLATYSTGLYKTDEQTPWGEKVRVNIIHPAPESEALLTEAILTADTQMNMMNLVDRPGNKKTPGDLAQYALDSAAANGYQATILRKEELQEKGLHALLAVGQGSPEAPVLICVEYKPDPDSTTPPKLGLVGKGITFDTGGLSIKGATNMHYMKSDMGGAAAVLGAVELAAKLKLDIHVVGIVPSAENAVDGHSVKPGDVIQSYSGKSIEIIDTDAEGRLILADGLAYIQDMYQPETIIDLATLTGSVVRTLAYAAGGLFTDDDQLANDLLEVGQTVHERLWRLPLWEDYSSDIHSDVADVRNFSGKPIAGAIMAAKFLQFFISDHPHWAHLDIAGVAFGDSEYRKMKGATGYGVRLLVAYMKRIQSRL